MGISFRFTKLFPCNASDVRERPCESWPNSSRRTDFDVVNPRSNNLGLAPRPAALLLRDHGVCLQGIRANTRGSGRLPRRRYRLSVFTRGLVCSW